MKDGEKLICVNKWEDVPFHQVLLEGLPRTQVLTKVSKRRRQTKAANAEMACKFNPTCDWPCVEITTQRRRQMLLLRAANAECIYRLSKEIAFDRIDTESTDDIAFADMPTM